ncbi:glutamate synthase-related protein [Neobacillus sp. D3-1R]|uniref:glutamate synthase-related protein n=1 Tax=Neobacillus sp. D3-1R TaxID=3445778 RepID=UPI003F9EC30D
MNKTWSPSTFNNFHQHEHDACGIVASLEKTKIPSRENIYHCIHALVTMNHRAGFINNEGDGVGIHIDIPRALWKNKLHKVDMNPEIVDQENFVVGHIFIGQKEKEASLAYILSTFKKYQLEIVFQSLNEIDPTALGTIALQENPLFLQIACLGPLVKQELSKILFELTIELEKNEAVHVASLSQDYAVYKVLGAGDILPKYYTDLADPLVASTMTLGHNRYSTNTLSSFFRVQPFSILGHNGEINTIQKLRDEAVKLNVPLVKGGSDSQDLSRTLETFLSRDGYSLFEAMDVMFPPILNEIKAYPKHLQDMYTYLREAWGHFAQGPAGIISRYQDEAVFSVDALGLRPLWMLETLDSYLFSSEPGIIPSSEYTGEPKPLAPGEKIGFKWDGETLKRYDQPSFQQEVYERLKKRLDIMNSHQRLQPPPFEKVVMMNYPEKINNGQYKAFGWEREHVQFVEQMAEKGAEPIRSLGHDSPLAALNPERKNIADFIKESVAVVTNPAIDRDRESEHFSTRVIIGKRPSLTENKKVDSVLELTSPILIEGKFGYECSSLLKQPSFDQLIHYYQERKLVAYVSSTFQENELIEAALERITEEALAAVQSGKTLIVLDDALAHHEQFWLDSHLVLSTVDQALQKANVRRNCSILLRSASLRSLHDLILSVGFGADLISPYYMFITVLENGTEPLVNLYSALIKGMEKVISTLGIHELRGYGRLFSAIGLDEKVASALDIVNFFGGDGLGLHFAKMESDAKDRARDYHDENARIGKSFHIFPRIWKSVGEIAQTGNYSVYRDKITEQEQENPTTIRHLTELKPSQKTISAQDVDIRVGKHDLPFVIASMSFGSQNEIAFRAYAEGADRLNMVSMNGEGGEIKDMLGKYPNTRGQQVASGRFGVNAELLNSSNLIEIKIGQGAKPGEGGHLPGSKVTAKIAEARNATIGSDLISPSNNHDIYSIEDLAQMIHEIKTANDQAKVAVKVPVVPNIGTIAVGIAKAGADIITVSGFDGGTGAARIHAIQHVGLPVEIGVKAAHNALLESGLRHQVEIWADGGLKSAMDVLKIMLLGANRVGFGTLSMISIGCTTCKGCHLDTCHVGIATQIETELQAKEHGLRKFVPRNLELAVQGIVHLYSAFGEELKQLAGSIGIQNLQAAVGRSDLLQQVKGEDQLNLAELLRTLDIAQFNQHEMDTITEPAAIQAAVGAEYLDQRVEDLHYSRDFYSVTSEQRVLGSRVSCHRVRGRLDGTYKSLPPIQLKYKNGSIPGNGLGAYNSAGINLEVHGGAQDGIGKTSFGGSIVILKSKGKDGKYYNGSVGKGFGYGAQKGLLVAQGNADARAGIRLSGADMIIGGQIQTPLPEKETGNVASRANIKGFAFEYMTNGRGLVLGDPGPWICAGMTGGVVYLRQQPEMGFTLDVMKKRIAKGAKVSITPLSVKGIADVEELLTKYIHILVESGQMEEASPLQSLLEHIDEHFVQIIPVKEQADPSVSTE